MQIKQKGKVSQNEVTFLACDKKICVYLNLDIKITFNWLTFIDETVS